MGSLWSGETSLQRSCTRSETNPMARASTTLAVMKRRLAGPVPESRRGRGALPLSVRAGMPSLGPLPRVECQADTPIRPGEGRPEESMTRERPDDHQKTVHQHKGEKVVSKLILLLQASARSLTQLVLGFCSHATSPPSAPNASRRGARSPEPKDPPV